MYDSIGTEGGPKRTFEVYDYARKNYKNEIEEKVKHNKKIVFSKLPEYVEAHKKYNNPVTFLGELGKKAAIYLGELDLDNLRKTVKLIRAWLNKYKTLSGEEQTKFFLQPKN